MDKYRLTGLIALLIVVVALPIYGLAEPSRMDAAQRSLSRQYVSDGALTYVENCAICHGSAGQGIGAMPPLDSPGLASADRAMLFQTIGHSPHGTAMATWHIDEGGLLNSWQVESLVTLIMNPDWDQVAQLADENGFVQPAVVAPEVRLATMEGDTEDPHECRACHEEPVLHAERFGLNCSRCHTLDAWKPALLTRHTFYLDHGGEGKVACETCHTTNYFEHTCYGCHDHQPEDMQAAHLQEEIYEFDNCAECHPTGVADEAARLGYGLSGRAYWGESPEAGEPGLGGEIPALPGQDGEQLPDPGSIQRGEGDAHLQEPGEGQGGGR
jgi:mono/diheme cytochrome c family protein